MLLHVCHLNGVEPEHRVPTLSEFFHHDLRCRISFSSGGWIKLPYHFASSPGRKQVHRPGSKCVRSMQHESRFLCTCNHIDSAPSDVAVHRHEDDADLELRMYVPSGKHLLNFNQDLDRCMTCISFPRKFQSLLRCHGVADILESRQKTQCDPFPVVEWLVDVACISRQGTALNRFFFFGRQRSRGIVPADRFKLR